MQFVIFKLGNERFGIETERVQSITEAMTITKVPKSPEYIKGLINLRGSIKPLVDLGMLLEVDSEKQDANIMILKVKEDEIGIEVDEVVEVIEIEENNLQKVNNKTKDYIRGVIELDDNLLTLIDIDKILSK